MILWAAVLVSLAAALVSAVLLARRVREHWPVAACLAAGLVIDLAIGHPDAWGIAGHLAAVPKPWHGGALALYHASNALVSLWPAALAVTAWAVFVGPERPTAPGRSTEPLGRGFRDGVDAMPEGRGWTDRPSGITSMRRVPIAVKAIAGAWLALNAALLAAWPVPGATVQRALLGAEVAALVAGAVAVGRGYRRAWRWPHAAVLWLLGVELVVVTLGPYRYSVYERWDIGQALYAAGFAVLAVLQTLAAHRLRREGP